MSLQKMLEYQKIDIAYYRQEKELKESEERKRAQLCKSKFLECNGALAELSKQVKSYFNALQKIEAKLAETEQFHTELTEKMDSISTEEEFSQLEAQLADYEKAVNDLNKDLAKITKAIADVSQQNRKLNDRMDAYNREYIISTQAYNKKKAVFEQQTQSTKETLAALAKEIEPAYLQRYLELRNNKKMPAFVPYMEKNCGACGMDISIEVDKKLNNPGDIAECPHCGRIVYKL